MLKTSDNTLLTTTGFEFTSSASGTTIKKKGNIRSERETIAKLGDTVILCTEFGLLYKYNKADGYTKRQDFNIEYNTKYNAPVTLLHTEADSLWIFNNYGIYNYKNGALRVLFSRNISDNFPVFGSSSFYRLSKNAFFISNEYGLFTIKHRHLIR